MEMKNIGKRFDKVLPKKGTMITTNYMAVKRVFAFKINEQIRIQKITIIEAAQRIHISNSTLNKFLNSDDDSVKLSTMRKVSYWLGKKLHIDIVRDDAADDIIPISHPGEILLTEFLLPLSISQAKLSREIGISAKSINEIVHGRKAISSDVAHSLFVYFGLSVNFWINLQTQYELRDQKRT